MMRLLLAIVLLLALFQAPARPQEEVQPEGEGKLDLTEFRCSQYIDLIDAEDGRLDVVLVWAHGYSTASRGVDEKNADPITWNTVGEFGAQLEQACRSKPDRLWVVTLKQLD